MKNYLKLILTVSCAAVAFSGCEKFLDTESYTTRNTSNFPSSETDAIQLVTGVYAALNGSVYEPSASYWMAAMIASDECYGGGGIDDYDCQADDHLLYYEPDVHSDYWKEFFAGITRAASTRTSAAPAGFVRPTTSRIPPGASSSFARRSAASSSM